MKRFLVLDSLRGLCALALVVHHSHIERSITELAFFRNASQLVGLFFAISGFVLYRRHIASVQTPRQLREFMVTRACRVMPLHSAVLLFFIGFECLKLIAEGSTSISLQAFSGDRAPAEILPNLLLIQAWWPAFNALSFNYPSWFISIEFYVWVLFGLILFAVPTLARKLFSLLCLVAFVALYKGIGPIPHYVLWGVACFFAGAITYRIYVRLHDSVPGPLLASVLELGILAAIYWVMTQGDPIPGAEPLTLGQLSTQLGVLFCAAILIFSYEAGIVSRVLSLWLFPAMGKLWLSIYLTHAAVIFVLGTALTVAARYSGYSLLVDKPGETAGSMMRYISTGTALNDNLLMLFVVTAVVVTSMLAYRFIERPGINLGKRLNRTNQLRRRWDDKPQTA